MADGFQVGDVVRLKSGGPKMTVVEAKGDPMTGKPSVWCTWFEGSKTENGIFPVAAVDLA